MTEGRRPSPDAQEPLPEREAVGGPAQTPVAANTPVETPSAGTARITPDPSEMTKGGRPRFPARGPVAFFTERRLRPREDGQEDPLRPWMKVVAWVSIAVAALSAAYVLLAWYAGRDVPDRVSAGGIEIGGLDPESARQRIESASPRWERRPLSVRLADQTVMLSPRQSGVRIDSIATVSQVTGLQLNPTTVWRRLRGGFDVPVRSSVDQAVLRTALASAAAQVERPVKEGSVTFPAAAVVADRPVAGRTVDFAATARAVEERWPQAPAVRGVVQEQAPRVPVEVFDQAVEAVARKAVAGPVEVVAAGGTVTVQPVQFAPALSMAEEGGALSLKVGEKEIVDILRSVGPALERPPVNATVRVDGLRPVVVPERAGSQIEGLSAVAEITKALTGSPRRAEVKSVPLAPTLTAGEVSGYRISSEIGRASVRFSADTESGKLANAGQAVKLLDGTVLAPGKPFSFNATVGARTADRGFVATAGTLPGIGKQDDGGVGQVASAVHEAAFRAGLLMGPRTAFSSYVPGLSAGLDARVGSDGPDVSFSADAAGGVLVTARTSGTSVDVVLWGPPDTETTVTALRPTKVTRPEAVRDRSAGCRARALQPGFDITVRRVLMVQGREERRDEIFTRYAPVPAVTCG
ncbi:VanW family protein [Austwickia chelonae]|uniref:VanW family protein n=1 Tax=Austwickia chelonae TaxID=100225 RepID=UPI000E27CCA9|nr:VanW family protein [Austwickia chelonae]